MLITDIALVFWTLVVPQKETSRRILFVIIYCKYSGGGIDPGVVSETQKYSETSTMHTAVTAGLQLALTQMEIP